MMKTAPSRLAFFSMLNLPPEACMAADRQTRREWLGAVPAAAAVASATAAQTSGAAHRPHIVLVISDQFRWDCIGAMGLNPMNLTPNLDQMASRGVMFRQAISNQPVCAPARASIFTGQYPSRHGVWKNALGLAENATTLATVMKQAGYSTNYIGKWHLARPEAGAQSDKSRYGVWKTALGLAENATPLATVMKQAGYSTNYIGKWHLARPEAGTAAETRGAVKVGHRGGFADLWEAAMAWS